jgi:cell division protein FtsB
MENKKKQFTLSLLMRILLGILIVVSIGIFANSAMRYNELVKEQKALEAEIEEYREMREELADLINSDLDYETIVRIAKERWGLYLPDEEIFQNDGKK